MTGGMSRGWLSLVALAGVTGDAQGSGPVLLGGLGAAGIVGGRKSGGII